MNEEQNKLNGTEADAPTKKKKKRVPITLPLTYDEDVDAYPVPFAFNGRIYTVKRGETVMVPPAVKKIAEELENAKKAAYEYSRSKTLSVKEKEFKERYNLA